MITDVVMETHNSAGGLIAPEAIEGQTGTRRVSQYVDFDPGFR